jgi:1-deoxy-D-xylulose-5-phosphate synthase
MIEPGRSELLKEGEDLIFAIGAMVQPALEAAFELEKKGISLAVANARFAKPLDEDMILRYAGPGRTVITAEEGVLAGGFGSAVREILDRESKFGMKFLRIGIPLDIYPVGKTDEIRRNLGLDVPGLVERIQKFYVNG